MLLALPGSPSELPGIPCWLNTWHYNTTHGPWSLLTNRHPLGAFTSHYYSCWWHLKIMNEHWKCWNAFNHWIKWGLPHGNQSAPTWALSTTPWGFAVLFGSHKMEHDKPNKNMADVRQGSTLLTGKKRLYSSICTLSPDLAHSMKCNESWAPSYPNK